jgi:hypothetical protein
VPTAEDCWFSPLPLIKWSAATLNLETFYEQALQFNIFKTKIMHRCLVLNVKFWQKKFKVTLFYLIYVWNCNVFYDWLCKSKLNILCSEPSIGLFLNYLAGILWLSLQIATIQHPIKLSLSTCFSLSTNYSPQPPHYGPSYLIGGGIGQYLTLN